MNTHECNQSFLELYKETGRQAFIIANEFIGWNAKSMNNMTNAQLKINEMILSKKLSSEDIKALKVALRHLTNDISNYGTSICSVCGNAQNEHNNMNIEHAIFKVSWGYESNYDTQNHELVLCCDCYTKHIMKGALGKYVKIEHYM
jgi:hypothetical protein